MRIGIDIRSLIEPLPSGVSEYTKQIVKHLVKIDKENEYLLFCNSVRNLPIKVQEEFQGTKSTKGRLRLWRIPNKLLNTSLFLLNQPKLDKMLKGVDLFFMPNLNFTAVSNSCKVILTVHDLSFKYRSYYTIKGNVWHRFVRPRKVFSRADQIIAVSNNTKNDLCEIFRLKPEKITIIQSGVDLSRFTDINKDNLVKIKRKYKLPKSFILYLATVEKRKNINGLLEAWQLYKQHHETASQLIIAGKISQKSFIKKDRTIKYLGYIPEIDKPYLYHLARAFVYPSYYEGFGLPVLEAMAAGLPVITSFGTSLPEVSGRGALLVDPNNCQELAVAIQQIVTNDNLRKNLTNQAHTIVKEFTWDKAARQTLSLFNS